MTVAKGRSRRAQPRTKDPMSMKEQDELDADYKASMASEADRMTSLESIYGKAGPPSDDLFPVGKPRMNLKEVIALRKKQAEELAANLPSVPEILKAVDDKAGVTHRVTVVKDNIFAYPDLYLDVYINGPSWEEATFAEMFSQARCKRATTIERADLVVFTGGVDVNPALYGAERHSRTETPSDERDTQDINVYLKCVELGIPMIGVCRGAQFLAVMEGAKLFQDVDGHNGSHPMFDHHTKTHIERVSSVHHQMVKPCVGMEVIATAARSHVRHSDPDTKEEGSHADIEVFYFRDHAIVGFQGHPEYRGYPQYTKWCLDTIQELVVCSPDIECKGGMYRIKPQLIELRHKAVVASIAEDKKKELN
jgi:gamma-glutamyl-gamma-aminobutyrate hydrolase PuuD